MVAEMLMHLLRAVAAPARCARFLQGEAAGRSMAVPVNWRAYSHTVVLDEEPSSNCARSSIAACDAIGLRTRLASSNQMRQTGGPARRAGAQSRNPPPYSTITERSLQVIGAFWSCFLVSEAPRPEHVKLAMLIPPLARAASRPGLQPSSLSFLLRPHPLYHSTRVFTSSPLHRKDAHGQRPAPGSQQALQDTKAAKPADSPAKVKVEKQIDPLLGERNLTNKEQRKADWTIIKEMTKYLWPKDNYGTRFRVGLSVALLLSAKLLNVQVPFYFKSIVDSMNIDFAAVGGTATTVAGSMIMACKLHQAIAIHLIQTEAKSIRWLNQNRRNCISRASQCRVCKRGTESYPQGSMQCVRALAQTRLKFPLDKTNGRFDQGY